MSSKIFIVILLLQTVHLFGDFTPLSTKKMLDAKAYGKPIFPIFLHGSVHGFGMALITYLFFSLQDALVVFLFQTIIHTTIDTFKGRLNLWFPSVSDIKKSKYWTIFGLDQYLHQLTILFIAWYLFISK